MTHNVGDVVIRGKVAIGASGATGTLTGSGIATIAKSATGRYLVTLSDSFPAFHSIHATMLSASAVDLVPQVRAYDASAKTVTISTLAAATETEPASGTELHILIFAKNSTAV